jgi:hypothetical protein
MMFPKVWFLNLIMAGLVVFAGNRIYKIWSAGNIAAVETAEAQKLQKQAENIIARRVSLSEPAYETIAKNDLWNPDRAEVLPEKPQPGPEVNRLSPSVKTIALYGTITTSGYKTALVAKLDAKPGEKKMQWIKVGDTLGSFKVIEIKGDGIVLTDSVYKYEVPVYEKERHEKATAMDKRETRPTIVSTAPVKNQSTGVSPVASKDSESAGEGSDAHESKYRDVKAPSEELRRLIISKHREMMASSSASQETENTGQQPSEGTDSTDVNSDHGGQTIRDWR